MIYHHQLIVNQYLPVFQYRVTLSWGQELWVSNSSITSLSLLSIRTGHLRVGLVSLFFFSAIMRLASLAVRSFVCPSTRSLTQSAGKCCKCGKYVAEKATSCCYPLLHAFRRCCCKAKQGVDKHSLLKVACVGYSVYLPNLLQS